MKNNIKIPGKDNVNDGTYWYRFSESVTYNIKFDSYFLELCSVKLKLEEYKVIKKTACGVWINLGVGEKKFVLEKAKKRWACPTIEEALISFEYRKRKQVKILKDQLEISSKALVAAEKLKKSKNYHEII